MSAHVDRRSEPRVQPVVDARGRRSDTRDRILAASIELFGKRGFDSTSLKDIATAVGIKAPAIYNHFDSKEHLLGEAVSWMITDFMTDVVIPDDPTLEPAARLRGLMNRHIAYQLNKGALARANDLMMETEALRHAMPDDAASRVRRDMREYIDLLTALVSDVDRSEHATPTEAARRARVVAFGIASMCDRVQTWWRPDGPLSADDVAEHFWQLVSKGLTTGA